MAKWLSFRCKDKVYESNQTKRNTTITTTRVSQKYCFFVCQTSLFPQLKGKRLDEGRPVQSNAEWFYFFTFPTTKQASKQAGKRTNTTISNRWLRKRMNPFAAIATDPSFIQPRMGYRCRFSLTCPVSIFRLHVRGHFNLFRSKFRSRYAPNFNWFTARFSRNFSLALSLCLSAFLYAVLSFPIGGGFHYFFHYVYALQTHLNWTRWIILCTAHEQWFLRALLHTFRMQ